MSFSESDRTSAEPAPQTSHPDFGRRGFYLRFGKRLVDLFTVVVMAPVLVPVIGLLSVIVKLDGGPAFVGDRRVGRFGKEFRCWRLRTMAPDADQNLQDFLARDSAARAEWDENYELENDPGVTGFGRFLRKTNLDELPQLWNVLLGEMSVVGPRPVTAPELELYGSAAKEILRVRPGITGAWQLGGRNDLSCSERAEIDATYTARITFRKDIGIIRKTAVVALKTTGK